jgi:hypothetical protein
LGEGTAGLPFAAGSASKHFGLKHPSRQEGTYDAVVALTDAFGRDHLNDEYRDLARAMTAVLRRRTSKPAGLRAAASALSKPKYARFCVDLELLALRIGCCH